MYSRLDHAVLAVRDLEEAAASFHRLGFHVVPGGEHPRWGTRNCLIFFDLTYLELVTVTEPDRARSTGFGGAVADALERGDGLVTAVPGTRDAAGLARVLRARGIPCGDPEPGERRRPDGSLVTWRNLFLPPPPGVPLLFAIEHGRPDPERRADLAAAGALQPHPLGVTGLTGVAWVAPDGAAAARALGAALGLEAVGPEVDPALGARVWQVPLPGGGLEVHEPLGAEGPAGQALARRGPGAYALRLRAPDLAAARRHLAGASVPAAEVAGALVVPPEAAHGAWLRLGP